MLATAQTGSDEQFNALLARLRVANEHFLQTEEAVGALPKVDGFTSLENVRQHIRVERRGIVIKCTYKRLTLVRKGRIVMPQAGARCLC